MGELNLNTRVRSVLRLSAAGATAVFLAGCSSDVSRLANGPFGPSDNTPTASIGSRTLTPPEAISGAPAVAAASSASWGSAPSTASASIQSAPLAPPSASSVTAAARPATQAVASAGASAVSSTARSAAGSFGPWTTSGGTPITVGQGESASVIAARYGVPMDALVKANGLTSASQVTPGKSLVIPVYNAGARQAAAARRAVAAAAAPAQGVRNLAASAPANAKTQAARAVEAPKTADNRREDRSRREGDRRARPRQDRGRRQDCCRQDRCGREDGRNREDCSGRFSQEGSGEGQRDGEARRTRASAGRRRGDRPGCRGRQARIPLARTRPHHPGLQERRERRHQHRGSRRHRSEGRRVRARSPTPATSSRATATSC